MLASKLLNGNVEFTQTGKSAIKRIFSTLDADKTGGLSYPEMVNFFAKTEPGFPFTRETFDGLGVETLQNNPDEISVSGFETFYRCMLESDFDLGIKRLKADLALFEHDDAVVVIMDDDEETLPQPEIKKQKKDAFAEMLQSRKQAVVGTKRQAKKPTKTTAAIAVEKPKPREEIDLTSRDSIILPKPVHPFFQPKSVKVVDTTNTITTTTTTTHVPVELLDFPLLPTRQSLPAPPPPPPPRRPALALLPPTSASTSILAKNIWTTTPEPEDSREVDEGNSNVAVVESELWTEKYKCTHSIDLLCTQKSRIQSFLTRWLESRQQRLNGLGSSSSSEEDEDLAWPDDTTPELPENEKHILLLYGPNGCGKTFPVHLIAKELGFRVLEVNASDDLLQVEKLHGQATQNYGLQQQGKKSKLAMPLILLDEFDSEFDTKHEEHTAAIKRFALRAKCPVVLITSGSDLPTQWSTNNWSVDRVRNFNIECVRCEMPPMEQVAQVLGRVIDKENLKMDPIQVATQYGGDLRRCLNHLQFGLKCDSSVASGNVLYQDSRIEFDGIPNLEVLCPFPRIDSVSIEGQVAGCGLQESNVYLNDQQVAVVDWSHDKLQLQVVTEQSTNNVITEQEEEDEMFEDTPQRNHFHVQSLHVVNEYIVERCCAVLRRRSNSVLVANDYAPALPQVKQTVIHVDAIDVEAARRNLHVLQALCNNIKDVDEGQQQLEEHQAKLKYWFTEFIHDRASFTCEVPFVVSMCRLEEENKLKMPSNRRGERKKIVKHFRSDLEWVNTEQTDIQFTIPNKPAVNKTRRRLVESD